MPDLFEQLVADYLTGQGYLTKLNVNYRKADGKQSGSDIDVLAHHPKTKEVIVADCKAWQVGLYWGLDVFSKSGAERQLRRFKAVFEREWAEGLTKKVEEELGTAEYTYTIYCTHKGKEDFSQQLQQMKTKDGHPISVVTLKEMLDQTFERVKNKPNKSVEPTTLGRFVQLVKAADLRFAADIPAARLKPNVKTAS